LCANFLDVLQNMYSIVLEHMLALGSIMK